MRHLARALWPAVVLIIAACTSVGERTTVSVGYYRVDGNTVRELDQQIRLHGPSIEGVGKAVAATNIHMIPDIRFARRNGVCRVVHSRMSVRARVTLPRHINQAALQRDLSQTWANLEEYARVHEAVHVAIADKHALAIERAILEQSPEADCATLELKTAALTRRLLEAHEREQLQFDEMEKRRLAALSRVRTGR